MTPDGGNAAAHQQTGVSTSPDVMKKRAREKLHAAGITFGLNRINREFVEFQKRQPGGNLDEFLQFLADPILTPMERKRTERMNNPDNARTISYADPTGEKATKKVYDETHGRGRNRNAAA